MVAIPSGARKKITDPQELTYLIYGLPKIGKSTFASKFPKAIFLDTEGGLKSLEVASIPVNNWEEFLDACKSLTEEKHDYRTVIIDTVEYAYRFCEDYVCKKAKIDYPSDADWGKGWALVRDEFTRVMVKLAKSKLGVVMICHAQVKEITMFGKTYSRFVAHLPNIASTVLSGLSDMILFIDNKTVPPDNKMVRTIHTKPSQFWEAGDRSGLLDSQIPFDFDVFMSFFKEKK